MRTLYFDVDGTVLPADEAHAKSRLASGKLEAEVRRAGFERLVCVGNYAGIARTIREMGVDYDALGVLFGMLGGAFGDEAWFRSVTTLVAEPERRTTLIDFSEDWWYVDDLAAEYCASGGQADVLAEHGGSRIFIPDPTGDGQDILDWLRSIPV